MLLTKPLLRRLVVRPSLATLRSLSTTPATSVTDLTKSGLDLIAKGQIAPAFGHLQAAVEAGGDDFPRSPEVFFALGLIAADDAAALRSGEEDNVTGGAANREEVLAQIKNARKEAMRRRNERRREQRASFKSSETAATTADTTSTTSGDESVPLEAKSESGGVTITRVAATAAAKSQAAPALPTSVEEVAPQEEQLSASFLQLAAERGHHGAMVALGNLALAAADGAEAASAAASSDPAHSGFLSPKDAKKLEMVAPAALGLALGWYSRAANNHDLALEALFKDSAARDVNAPRAAIVVTSANVVTSSASNDSALHAADTEPTPSSSSSSSLSEANAAMKSELPPHPDALFNLGQVFYGGRGGLPGGPQPSRGMHFFELAALHGDCAAHFFLAHAKRCGDEGAGWDPYRDPQAAVDHLIAATEPNKSSRSNNNHSDSINSNSDNSSSDSVFDGTNSSSSSRSSSNSTSPETITTHGPAAYYRALLHRSGDPGLPPPFNEPNLAAFRQWVGAAASAGDGEAIFCLADCHLHGSDGFPRDPTATLGLWQRAASETDHAGALCCLGAVAYGGLLGQPRDLQAAFAYYSRAAELAEPPDHFSTEQLSLASATLERASTAAGTSTRSRNNSELLAEREEAVAVANQAALAAASHSSEEPSAFMDAWSNLAAMYALGHGVPRCLDTAKHILRVLDGIKLKAGR